MATGRTVSKWTRFAVDDNGGTPREIPVDSISAVGFTYDETELTAYQDQVKGYLADHPDSPIDITGPFDNTAATTLAASAAVPTLSGSHTVLAPISAPTFTTPLGLWVGFGIRTWWTTGDPAFGVVAPSATSGYVCMSYTVEGEKYSASFKPYPGTVPAWGAAIIT
jgi:hypothetical protein